MTNPFAESPRQLTPVPDPSDDTDATPEPKDTVDPVPAEDVWPHQTLEFKGDVLQVRKPTPQALAAFSLGTSKFVSNQTRNDMTGLFIQRHMSADSFERVFSRLMNPDETEYTVDTIGELMRSVVLLPAEGAE